MKTALRKKFLAIRRDIPPAYRKSASDKIVKKILGSKEWKQAKTICLYRPFPSEVDTGKLFIQSSKQIVLPGDRIDADLYIVPGVAFDKRGWRLGRGKGFYDRLLAKKSALKIGAAFDAQVIAELPHFPYDIPMDMVVTEKHTYAKTS